MTCSEIWWGGAGCTLSALTLIFWVLGVLVTLKDIVTCRVAGSMAIFPHVTLVLCEWNSANSKPSNGSEKGRFVRLVWEARWSRMDWDRLRGERTCSHGAQTQGQRPQAAPPPARRHRSRCAPETTLLPKGRPSRFHKSASCCESAAAWRVALAHRREMSWQDPSKSSIE